jgi:hypothetical protein
MRPPHIDLWAAPADVLREPLAGKAFIPALRGPSSNYRGCAAPPRSRRQWQRL